MILWGLSDLVFLLLNICLIQNLILVVLFWARRFLERRFSMSQMDRILKLTLAYFLFALPLLTAWILYKSTYTSVRYVGGELPWRITIRNWSLSAMSSRYGNYWIFAALLALWAAGVIWKGILPHCRSRRLFRRLKKVSVQMDANSGIQILSEKIREERGVRQNLRIWESACVDIPFVTGILHPDLFFPQSSSDEGSQKLLLTHEWIHCKNHDCLYRRFLFLLCGLCWFNPVVYRFACYFVEVNEMACDEELLRKASSEERGLYAKLLVSFHQEGGLLKGAVSLTGHTESGIERRLKHMLKEQRQTTKRSAILLTGLLILLCPFTTLAAATGTSMLQDRIVDRAFPAVEEEMNGLENTLTEVTDFVEMKDLQNEDRVLKARGVTTIDETLEGREYKSLGTATLAKGSKATIIAWGENPDDKFRVGYRDSSGKRTYVSTSTGEIDHTFTMPSAGTYTFFLEGISDKTVHVEGSLSTR